MVRLCTRAAALVGPVALVTLGLALRGASLGERQLFRDEAASWLLADYSLPNLLAHTARETFPPLYPLLLKGWMGVFGSDEAALRSLSVVAGVGIVLVTWRWARDALGQIGALIASGIVLLSPVMIANARVARMYSLETFFATTAWWVLWRLVVEWENWPASRRLAASAALVFAVAGEVWTLSLGLPIAALQLTFALVSIIWLGNRGSTVAAACIVAGGLTLTPWLPALLSTALNGQSFWTPRPELDALKGTVLQSFVGVPNDALWPVSWFAVSCAAAGPLALIFGGLGGRMPALDALTPTLPSWVRRERLLALALTLGFGLVPVAWLVSQVHSIYDPRYLGAAIPPFAIAIAATAVMFGRTVSRVSRTARHAPQGLLAICLVVPVVATMAATAASAIDESRRDVGSQPARQTVQELALLVRPGDVVLALNAQTYFPLHYYLDRTGEGQRLGVQLYDWHAPSDPFFTGWADIDAGRLMEPATVSRIGWRPALHLESNATLWLVTVTNGDRQSIGFAPLQSGQLREVSRTFVNEGGVVGQILRLAIASP
jgi:4-amino-4-deoxy-L-arabinose transferase-like glycosyltransferase